MTSGRGLVAPVLLILVAAALAGIIGLEFGQHMPERDAMVPAPAARPSAPVAFAPAALADNAEHRVAVVLARPLFSPGRRPPAQPASISAVGVSLPRMTAVVVTPQGRRATFANGTDGSVVVTEGSRIGAYGVQSIEAGRVLLAGPDGLRVVTPSFDPKPPSPPAGPPAALLGLPDPQGLSGLGGAPPNLAVPGAAGFTR